MPLLSLKKWSMSLYYSSRKVPGRCENSFVNYRINYQKLCDLMRQITKELNWPNVLYQNRHCCDWGGCFFHHFFTKWYLHIIGTHFSPLQMLLFPKTTVIVSLSSMGCLCRQCLYPTSSVIEVLTFIHCYSWKAYLHMCRKFCTLHHS